MKEERRKRGGRELIQGKGEGKDGERERRKERKGE